MTNVNFELASDIFALLLIPFLFYLSFKFIRMANSEPVIVRRSHKPLDLRCNSKTHNTKIHR